MMHNIETVKSRLMDLAEEYELFEDAPPERYATVDLIEHGLIDSMTAVYFQEILHEHFSVEIPAESFVLELRTMDALAQYVLTNITNQGKALKHV